MRKIITSIATATLLLLSMSASAGVAQVWRCTFADDATGSDLIALSKEWLDAAREINDSASARVFYPVAADAEEDAYIFVFYLPDFTAWGAFSDAYPDSPVAEVDSRWDGLGPCDVSGLWITEDIE
jgi:hypothetical protein